MHTSRRPFLGLGAFALLLAAGSAPAQADEKPNAEQRVRIEAALRALGYVRWDDIELSDERTAWKVDDARMPDGSKWDLRLAVDDLRVLRRERD